MAKTFQEPWWPQIQISYRTSCEEASADLPPAVVAVGTADFLEIDGQEPWLVTVLLIILIAKPHAPSMAPREIGGPTERNHTSEQVLNFEYADAVNP